LDVTSFEGKEKRDDCSSRVTKLFVGIESDDQRVYGMHMLTGLASDS